MLQNEITLGAFRLESPIGRGGMGDVWLATHVEQNIPVAVKVLTADHAQKEAFRGVFRNEIQAVAGLDHPSIVMVFDYGVIPTAAEKASKGRLRRECPYLAMEFASGGALDSLKLPLPWPQTRRIILTLLDALAHAHARGVIHRDLKPANVLIGAAGDLRPGLKLTDFGIAHAGREDDSGMTESPAGTPQYMAPEQLRGLWRDYGPWTDLYALGCMTFQLVTGRVPYRGRSYVELARRHILDPIPPLPEDADVPPGFEGWLWQMMGKDPTHRFQRAADAAWALQQLDGLSGVAEEGGATKITLERMDDAVLELERRRSQAFPMASSREMAVDARSARRMSMLAAAESIEIAPTIAVPGGDDPVTKDGALDTLDGTKDGEIGTFAAGPAISAVGLEGAEEQIANAGASVSEDQTVALGAGAASQIDESPEPDGSEDGQDDAGDRVVESRAPGTALIAGGGDGGPALADDFAPAMGELEGVGTQMLGADPVDVGPGPDVDDATAFERPTSADDATAFERPAPADDATQMARPQTSVDADEPLTTGNFPAGTSSASQRPPLPEDWRVDEIPTVPLTMLGAGLGIFEFRAVPLVDRDDERDQIWEALQEVVHERRARAVVVRGAAGIGKSRLAEWFAHRAHELGAVQVLRARHSPTRGATDALAKMVGLELGCHGLERAQVHNRVEEVLLRLGAADEFDRDALTEMISPLQGDDAKKTTGRTISFSSPHQRHVLLERLLSRLSERRPLLLWLDDVQWGADSIGFVSFLMQRQDERSFPALILLTARDDVLAERRIERAMLEEAVEQGWVDELTLGSLDESDLRLLVQRMLGIDESVAALVAARSGGNPLFAVQLLADWVQRDVLRIGRRGFVPSTGKHTMLPDDIHQVWSGRLARALEGTPEDGIYSLELAAVLGHEVDRVEWEEACARAEVPARTQALEALADVRLVVSTDDGWRFAHGMLRESLERDARDREKWKDYNRACAIMLKSRRAKGFEVNDERLGRHLLEAGELEQALAPLLAGARSHRAAAEYRAALLLLQLREDALRDLRILQRDVRWATGWILRAEVHLLLGEVDDALDCAEQAERAARHSGQDGLLADALRAQGDVARQRGDIDSAREFYGSALEHYGQVNVVLRGAPAAHRGLAMVARHRGDLETAAREYEAARDASKQCKDVRGQAIALNGLGQLARLQGEPEKARTLLHEARELHEESGNTMGVGHCLTGLGELARAEHDLPAAEQYYREAYRAYEAVGSSTALFPQMNLGLVLIEWERYDEARSVLEAASRSLAHRGMDAMLGCVHLTLLPCVAHAGDWEAWEEHLRLGTELLSGTDRREPDVAICAERAASLAKTLGEDERAQAALDVALEHWTSLGRFDDVERASTILDADDESS